MALLSTVSPKQTQEVGKSTQFLEEEDVDRGTPLRYVPLCDVYSATSPCVSASGSKKVKAARKILNGSDRPKQQHDHPTMGPPIVQVYTRRRKRGLQYPCPFFDLLKLQAKDVKLEPSDGREDADSVDGKKKRKKRRLGCSELSKLGVDLDSKPNMNGVCLRETRFRTGKRSCNGNDTNTRSNVRRRNGADDLKSGQSSKNSGSAEKKRWVWLNFEEVNPKKFIGLRCKVYWPLDADWYSGCIIGYSSETGQHHVKYDDGDEENLVLSNEKIKFLISLEELQRSKLQCCDKCPDVDGIDVDEMLVFAASLDDCQEPGPGDIIWAKLTGYAMWPAIVLDESLIGERKGLNRISGEKSVPVQFFGSHDFARVKTKQVISFLKGLLLSFHQKCKRQSFVQSLEEAKLYLSEQKLPKRMIRLRSGEEVDCYDSEGGADSGQEYSGNGAQRRLEGIPNSGLHSDFSKIPSVRLQNQPAGFRPVNVKWKDLDKCNVCHMDEEYENNLFLQCDKCRMMVHARCYGESEPIDGVLWLCNLCRPGAPEYPPPCCLCPVVGGAMKLTTDGRWAHLACAIWIPETCLSDIKKMEPIDGLSRINKDRWKLLCSICGVSYGACIQCSNNTCRVAYHPLCARAAGFCVELEDEDKLHLIPSDEDEEDQCIRLLSYCKRHRPASGDYSNADELTGKKARNCSEYVPPLNPSGCARCEPYNYFGRRGRKEPEALAAASLKRLYVENQPYLVGGVSQHEPLVDAPSSTAVAGSKFSVGLEKLKKYELDTSRRSILSVAEKYSYMRETIKKRLAFGKSGIHGFGIFAKYPHRAGDMMIEYTGELVRPPVADRREHLIYNSLVGAGTYMFQIDNERVIDATRAGSIAHLINHSCEPNCYSRAISVNGDEHIIIFAKRDIKQWEELTYDYRFFSIDERLACYCGVPRCRGFVNDPDAEERMAKQYAPRDQLIDWDGE